MVDLKKRDITLIFILINLLLSVLIFLLINLILFKKINYLNYYQPLNIKVIKNYKTLPLIKGDIIKGEFTAEKNFLGALWIKFDMSEKIVEDKIIFRIKEKNDKKWLFETIYDSKFFTGHENYPFGIKPIPNSQGKKYIFQLESLYGDPENGVKLGKTEPLVSLQYQIPINLILNLEYLDLFSYPFTIISFFIFFFTLIIYKTLFKKQNLKINYLLLILFFGLLWRIILIFSPITFDLRQFANNIEFFLKQENIYLKQTYYNYTPFYYYILGFIGFLNQKIFFKISNFILIRFFLLIIDYFILLTLKKILEIKKIKIEWLALFFLNPIVFITSIHQGQFDNLAILFLLLSYLSYLNKNVFRQFLFLTLALTIKHILLIPVLFAFFSFYKKRVALVLFTLASFIFFISFIPYISTAKYQIINNVFKYQANKTIYGFGYLINNLQYFYPLIKKIENYYFVLFLTGAFVLALKLKNKNISKKIFLGFLYFLTFTPGIHSHYFALPIVFSIFNFSAIAPAYFLAVFLYYIPFYAGYGYLAPITPQSIWIFAFTWFLVELIGYEKIKTIIKK